MNESELKIAFFGGEPLGLPALQTLVKAGLTPTLVVCNPDRPKGRGHKLAAPRIKVWAQEQGIDVFQPTSYKNENRENLGQLTGTAWDIFVVVAYNFILPDWFLELPKHGTINVHPSLLPKLRGMSPIRTAILENTPELVGVSIMLMDEKMDHGPLLAQVPLATYDKNWPEDGPMLDLKLAAYGGELLAQTIPLWIEGTLTPTPQNHDKATYTKKFEKADSELTLDLNNLPTGHTALAALCKIRAFSGIGDTFFVDNGTRVKIKSAAIKDDTLVLSRVIPEGKKEMDFELYLTTRSN